MRLTLNNRARQNATIEIAVTDFGGSGPLALLHHANGFSSGTWGLVARHLAEHYRVFAIDARGHGDSEGGEVPKDFDWNYFVDDLVAVAKHLCEISGTVRNLIFLWRHHHGVGGSERTWPF